MTDVDATFSESGSIDYSIGEDTRIGIYGDGDEKFEIVYCIQHIHEDIGTMKYTNLDNKGMHEMGIAAFRRLLDEAVDDGKGFAVWQA